MDFSAETAREMLESGNFIAPTLNYESWNDKPILNHWLVALSYSLFGISEYASRIPLHFCASITCVATFVFSRIFLGRKIAFAAALMLLSSYLFQILSRVSLTDMPLTLFCQLRTVSTVYWADKTRPTLHLCRLRRARHGVSNQRSDLPTLIFFGSFLL